jgi:hypothetical protein
MKAAGYGELGVRRAEDKVVEAEQLEKDRWNRTAGTGQLV